jgi:hypothetical protein
MSYNLYRIIQFIYHLFQSTKEGEGIALIETYNEALAHLTFADSDIIFVLPLMIQCCKWRYAKQVCFPVSVSKLRLKFVSGTQKMILIEQGNNQQSKV